MAKIHAPSNKCRASWAEISGAREGAPNARAEWRGSRRKIVVDATDRKVVLTCAVTGNAPFNRNHAALPVAPAPRWPG